MAELKDTKVKYDEHSIQSFEGMAAIRKRPTMYIHSIGSYGVFKMFLEILTNSVDEFTQDRCSHITVMINTKEQSMNIADNGAGIPLGKLKEILEKPHVGGKFDSGAYKFQAGMNGVGTTATNALSEIFRAEVKRDGRHVLVEYRQGKLHEEKELPHTDNQTGTNIYFIPDGSVLGEFDLDYDTFFNQVEATAHINAGLGITFIWDKNKPIEIRSEGGLKEYLAILSKRNKMKIVCDPIPISTQSSDDSMRILLGLGFSTNTNKELMVSYVNGLVTEKHGKHVVGVRAGATMAINKYISDNGLVPKNAKYSINSSDVQEAMVCVVAASHLNPLFNGQTKEEFTSDDYFHFAKSAVYQSILDYFSNNPEEAQKICKLIRRIAESRYAGQTARDEKLKPSTIKKSFGKVTAMLKDCKSSDKEKCEMFIVEGISASGSANSARDINYQALYLLQGKIKNVVSKKGLNDDLKELISVLNCGTGVHYNENKLRFNKVIIMTDADPDGSHIRALLVGFFYTHLPRLIEGGHLYMVNPPLFSIKMGKKHVYLLNKDHYNTARERVAVNGFELITSKGVVLSEDIFRVYIRKVIEVSSAIKRYAEWLNVDPNLLESIILNLDDMIDGKYDEMKRAGFNTSLMSKNKNGVVYEFDNGSDHLFFELNDDFIQNAYSELFALMKDLYLSQVFIRSKKSEKLFGGTAYMNGKFIEGLLDSVARNGVSRYKGLGEMPPSLLEKTAMNSESRTIVQISMDDAKKAHNSIQTFLGKDKANKKEILSYNNM